MGNSKTEKFVKVKQSKNIDLQKVCADYEISVDDLISFHNNHCHISEFLTISTPKYVEFLYIPFANFKKRQDKLLQDPILKRTDTEEMKQYGVVMKFSPKNLMIKYKVDVKFSENTVEINKHQTFVNNQPVDKLVEQLVETAEKSLYPLKLSLKSNGAIDHIANSNDVKKRWTEEYYPYLLQYYQSDIAVEILRNLNATFTEISNKENLLYRNLFYRFLFLPVYKNYYDFEGKGLVKVYFSALKREITYSSNLYLNEKYSISNQIALRIEGVEELDKQAKNQGKLQASYNFNRDSHLISSIVGSMSAYEEDEEYRIEFQIDQLN